MGEKVIEIEGLTKDYEVGFLSKRSLRALDQLSFTVERGEIFGFLGANGAGKTTTLKILMGLIRPTAGAAHIFGIPVTSRWARARVGYLPEQPNFYDYLTARELVAYFAELTGFRRAEARRRAADALRLVRLDEKNWDRLLRHFSKGMLQRVGLAQALVSAPELLILDEPMSGLDAVGRREVRDLIAELARSSGVTILFSTHILADAERLCDRVCVIERGRPKFIGRLDEIEQRRASPLEIILVAREAKEVGAHLAHELGDKAEMRASASGQVVVRIREESEVDHVLKLAREKGAKLVAVQRVGLLLEELFDATTDR
jgi:ABC-2 type transport system ATP-binding protein